MMKDNLEIIQLRQQGRHAEFALKILEQRVLSMCSALKAVAIACKNCRRR